MRSVRVMFIVYLAAIVAGIVCAIALGISGR
jgi:energy-converting hydrogenase Eha subunit A